jgi:hypothetical protein
MHALDARGFTSFFTEGGILRLGNNEPVLGRDRIEANMAGFCSAIGGLSHDFQNCWALKDRAFANGLVWDAPGLLALPAGVGLLRGGGGAA